MTIWSFSVRRNKKIACRFTVRGEKSEEILEKGLNVNEYELCKGNFNKKGSFGSAFRNTSILVSSTIQACASTA